MQMSENNRFLSFALDSAHVKCDVQNGPNVKKTSSSVFRPDKIRAARFLNGFKNVPRKVSLESPSYVTCSDFAAE